MQTLIAIPANILYLSEDEIKEFAKANIANGEYLATLCKKCGSVTVSSDANTDNVIFKIRCRECFERE